MAIAVTIGMAGGEVIDRIAVSVGSRVITRSEIDRQIRVIAFQNGVKPDLSVANRHAAAEKMIQQKLIQHELESSRYPAPVPAELAPAIEEFKRKNFKSEAEYQSRLKAYEITEQDLLDVLLWERTLLRFIEIRFESGVLLTDQETADYARKNHVTVAAAERALTSARADQQLDQWLRDARRRADVVIHEEAFR
jgi:hypothetical protein